MPVIFEERHSLRWYTSVPVSSTELGEAVAVAAITARKKATTTISRWAMATSSRDDAAEKSVDKFLFKKITLDDLQAESFMEKGEGEYVLQQLD